MRQVYHVPANTIDGSIKWNAGNEDTEYIESFYKMDICLRVIMHALISKDYLWKTDLFFDENT